MNSNKFFALLVISCMLSVDILIPAVLAGHHGNRGGHGIELLLAAGILAKLLRKKGHHHHHHGHHHHGHHHGHHESKMVEVVHLAPPMGGYSSHYPASGAHYPGTAQTSYSGMAPQATTSFSSSVEYPFMPSASHSLPLHHMPYGGPASVASFLGYEPQPINYGPPPMPEPQPQPHQR